MDKVCCGFGHRNLYKFIDNELDKLIEELISVHNVQTFMTGDMGDFDKKFSSSVRAAKRKYKDIELILVLPYFSNKINTNKEYYEQLYDEVILSETVIGVHHKRAITECNHWMIDKSDFVLSCVYRDYGGAYDAMKYAEKKGKLYVNISDK